MTVFFTADQHWGHKRIIELAQRPFASVEEMDEIMVERWNQRVSRRDTVYHLGDFAFAEHDSYLRRLNGEKHLIPGNHDHRGRIKRAMLWHTIEDKLTFIKIMGKVQVVLCHYAMRVWRNAHHGALHFYGHSHGNLLGDSQCLDVGVDCWSFAPISFDQIALRLLEQPVRGEPDHHRIGLER